MWKGLVLDSDHAILVASFRLKLKSRARTRLQRRFDVAKLAEDGVKDNFQLELRNSFQQLESVDDPETCWVNIVSAVSAAAENTLGFAKKKSKPWITTESYNAIQSCTEARDRGAQHAEFQRLRKEKHASLKRDKNAFLEARADEMNEADRVGDTRKLHRLRKEMSGRRSTMGAVVKAKNGEAIANERAKVDRWGEHFNELLNRPRPAHPLEDPRFMNGGLDVPQDPPTNAEIIRAIRALKTGRAAGEDNLPPDLFVHGGPELVDKLRGLYEAIWAAEMIPTGWKTAVVIPLFKKGDKASCSNYRGISLLDIALKILEAVIMNRIRPEHELNAHARENQAGFRPGRGCRDQIFTVRQLLETRYEFRRPTIMVFIDFKAAFDSVDRESLWKVADAFGLPIKIVDMLKVLYSETRCVVRVYNTLTDSFEVSTGVRQGSVLSPYLFNLAIDWTMDEATHNIVGCGIEVEGRDSRLYDLEYADDVVLLAETEREAQELLNRVASAAAHLGLQINATKTKVIHCSCPEPAIVLGAEVLEVKLGFEYLGSKVVGNGDASAEIKARIAKATGAFKALDPLWRRRDIRTKIKAKIYDSCVRSVLLYGCETWPLKIADADRLATFERQCWRRCLPFKPGSRPKNAEVERRFYHKTPLIKIIQERRLRWCGHVLRMDPSRLPRQTIAANSTKLPGWKRPAVGVKKTWRRLVGDEIYKQADAVFPRTANPPKWRKEWPRICIANLKPDGTEVDRQAGRNDWKQIVRDTVSGAAAGRAVRNARRPRGQGAARP